MAESILDVVVVGAGPAGLAAGLYVARGGYEGLILEKFAPGGQIATTDRIENYPGIQRIDGMTLIQQMEAQVQAFGGRVSTGTEVTGIRRTHDGVLQTLTTEQTFLSRAVILAVGSTYRRLGVPGEQKFRSAGAGVSYCGTCDGPFFKGKQVVAVGGGNTALEEALFLCKHCKKVTLVHRRDQFRADKILVDELMAKAREPQSNLSILYNTVVTAIQGSERVESVRLKDTQTCREQDYPCDGVFIFVGMVPNTGFLKGVVDLAQTGLIRCDPAGLRTSLPGVFVAGDCRVGAAMQLATAIGDGVQAAVLLKEYLRDPRWWDRVTA